MEIDKLLMEFINIKNIKQQAIKIQDYEKAANSRDKEKTYINKICDLYIKEFESYHPQRDISTVFSSTREDFAYHIFKERFGIEINYSTNAEDVLKILNRNNKLEDLGI